MPAREERSNEIQKENAEFKEVLEDIIKEERRGVNVEEAWDFYAEAKEKKDKDEEEAKLNLERAKSDLSRKGVLYKSSNTAFWANIPLLGLVLVFLVLLIKGMVPEDVVVLGVPSFIICWGLVGSASYVLLSAYGKIFQRVFDYYDFLGYSYRFVIGGVLAAVVFYVVQLGVVSLPGYAGEQVNAALERAEGAKEYQEAFILSKLHKPRIEEYLDIIESFDAAAEDGVLAKVTVLDEYREEWEKYHAVCTIEREERAPETVRVTAERVKTLWDSYACDKPNLDQELELYYASLRDAIKDKMGPDLFSPVEEALAVQGGDTESRLVILSAYVGENESFDISFDTPEGLKKFTVSNKKSVEDYVKGYHERDRELTRRCEDIDKMFEAVRKEFVAKVSKVKEEYAAAEKKVRKWRVYFQSLDLEDELKKLDAEIRVLKEEKLSIEKDYYCGEGKEEGVGTETAASGDLEDRLKVITYELERKEDKRKVLKENLIAAYRDEAGRPLWKSPVFIVLAFLSGFSVKLSTGLFDQLQEKILSKVRVSNGGKDKGDNKKGETAPVAKPEGPQGKTTPAPEVKPPEEGGDKGKG